MKIFFFFLTFFLFQHDGHARGPYLPDFEQISAVPGRLVFLGPLFEAIDDHLAPYPGIGIALQEDQSFLLAQIHYQCSIIDDGPYGAISCTSGRWQTETQVRYQHCEFERDFWHCQ